MPHTKLYIPGPIEVSAKTFQAMTQPMIGHRSKDFQALYGRIMPMLQQVFVTKQPVFISTSSAWGVMEGSVRNLVAKKVLNCCCGAFSDKWYDVSLACGKQAEALKVEWGQPITPEAVDAALSKGGFDAVTLVHSETSTGVANDIAAVRRTIDDASHPALLMVDTVSSLAAMERRYGVNLDANSHGQSFLKLFQSRFVPGGLYLLDEPEAPLSPQSQLALIAMISDMIAQDSQFIIATHSPILLGFPDALIYSFDRTPVEAVPFEELDHVVITRDFLNAPERFLRHL